MKARGGMERGSYFELPEGNISRRDNPALSLLQLARRPSCHGLRIRGRRGEAYGRVMQPQYLYMMFAIVMRGDT